jgi:transposase InsO family protein
MGQILHGSATTTEAVRRAIQNSQASLRQLAVRYGINPKTVAKWRRRSSVCDARMGPSEPRSTVLSNQEEALVVAFRKHTLLPLDDCLYALQATVPHLTRSSLHRCFQRHGISRLPETQGDKPARKKFKSYPIGYFHIDIAEVRTEQGKLYLFVAIDRTSKFAYAELHEKANRWIATDFLKALIKAVPYKIHTVLTDNGIQFTDLPKNRLGPTARWRTHMFDMLCDANSIEHRLTKPNHPWTNGQVERMNRTLKEATVQRYHYGTHAQLKAHLHAFLMAYNFAKRLKTLKGLTPYEHICKVWTTQPNRFRLDPLHHTVGLNMAHSLRNPGSAKYQWAKFPAVVTDGSVNYCATVDAQSPYAAYNGRQAYVVHAQTSGNRVSSAVVGLIAGGKDFALVTNMCAKYGLDPRNAS